MRAVIWDKKGAISRLSPDASWFFRTSVLPFGIMRC
jgi:hypothetical protein